MAEEIRLSLFLSAGMCLGLPMLVWSLCCLRRLQDAGLHVSAFVVSLIFSDMLEILLAPFVNTRFLEEKPCLHHLPCWVLYSTFAEARLCGLHFHQLVALEGILSMVYPPHCLSFLCSLILSVMVWILVISLNFFTFGYTVNLMMCVMPVILAIITSVFAIRAKHQSAAGPLKHIDLSWLAVALSTLVVLYVPCLVLSCVNYPLPFHESPWATTAVAIMSLRLTTDPLLCVLVCRQMLMCQIQQRHTAAREVQESDHNPNPRCQADPNVSDSTETHCSERGPGVRQILMCQTQRRHIAAREVQESDPNPNPRCQADPNVSDSMETHCSERGSDSNVSDSAENQRGPGVRQIQHDQERISP